MKQQTEKDTSLTIKAEELKRIKARSDYDISVGATTQEQEL